MDEIEIKVEHKDCSGNDRFSASKNELNMLQ